MADVSVNILLKVQEGINAMTKLQAEVNKSVKAIEKDVKDAGSAFEVFKGTIAGQAVIKGLSLITDSVQNLANAIVTDGVQSAIQYENAVKGLQTAFEATGIASAETINDFKAFADAQENASKFSDDAILTNAAYIQSLSGLTNDGLKGATKAAIDLAAATGKDLAEASDIVAKAAVGNTTALSKLGFEFKKGATDSEKFAAALEQINQKFGGAALKSLDTFEGSVIQSKNAFEDFTKAIGETITKNPAVLAALQGLAKIFNGLETSVKNNKDSIASFIKDGLGQVLQISGFVISGIGTLSEAFIKFKNIFPTIGVLVRGVFDDMTEVAINFLDAINIGGAFDSQLAAARKALDASREIGRQSEEDIGKSLLAAEQNKQFFDKLGQDITLLGINVQNTQTKITEDAKSGSENQGKAIAEGTAKGAAEVKKNLEKIKSDVKEVPTVFAEAFGPQITDNLLNIGASLGNAFAIDRTIEAKLAELNNVFFLSAEQRAIGEAQIQQAAFQQSLDAQLVFREQQSQAELLSQADQLLLKQAFYQEQLNQESLNAQQKLVIQRNLNKVRAQIQQQADAKFLADQQTFLSTASTLAQSESKTLAAIGKAAAITQIAIKTPPAVASSFEFGAAIGGPPLGFVFAGIAATAMAAQAAAIAGVPLATGGTIPGGFPNDTFPARLTSGERVVNVAENRDLTSFLSNQNGQDSGNVENLLGEIISRLDKLENTTVVNIGNKEITRVVNEAIRSGRALAG